MTTPYTPAAETRHLHGQLTCSERDEPAICGCVIPRGARHRLFADGLRAWSGCGCCPFAEGGERRDAA